MKRVFVIVEGETEERFLRKVVYDHLIVRGIHLEPQQWLTNRKLGTGGGGKSFDLVFNHLNRLNSKYQNDPSSYISTMIDFYGFPRQGNYTIFDAEIERLSSGLQKVLLLEERLAKLIPSRNFIPYVQLHEFEALLFSNIDALSQFYPDREKNIADLKKEVAGKAPEDINETPQNAPSKRIMRHIGPYQKQKTTAGVMTAEIIGLQAIRNACPHFHSWICRLEQL